MLTTVVAALPQETEVLLAPAMNIEMWKNPIIQASVELLKSYAKYVFVEPREGMLACRDEGSGKIAGNDAILEKVQKMIG